MYRENSINLKSEWDEKRISNNKYFKFLSNFWNAYLRKDFYFMLQETFFSCMEKIQIMLLKIF